MEAAIERLLRDRRPEHLWHRTWRTSRTIGKSGVADLAPDPRDGLARDRTLIVNRMLSNASENPAQFVGTRRQVQIREQRGDCRQPGVLADDDAIRAAQQHRV